MLIGAAELLHRVGELSPTCREPQVFMDRPHCNCMVGIDMVRKIIEAMMEKGNDMSANKLNGYGSAHDPLCPSRIGCECECHLIAIVREDEQDCEKHGETISYYCKHYQQGRKDGHSTALQSAGELVALQLGKCHADSSTAIVLKKIIDWIDNLEGKL